MFRGFAIDQRARPGAALRDDEPAPALTSGGTESASDLAVARMPLRSSPRPSAPTFAVVRRRAAVFEQPVALAHRAERPWRTCAPYDPYRVNQAPEAFGGLHSCVWRGPKNGRTTAVCLGLAAGEFRVEHAIGFDMREATERLRGAGQGPRDKDDVVPRSDPRG